MTMGYQRPLQATDLWKVSNTVSVEELANENQ